MGGDLVFGGAFPRQDQLWRKMTGTMYMALILSFLPQLIMLSGHINIIFLSLILCNIWLATLSESDIFSERGEEEPLVPHGPGPGGQKMSDRFLLIKLC